MIYRHKITGKVYILIFGGYKFEGYTHMYSAYPHGWEGEPIFGLKAAKQNFNKI